MIDHMSTYATDYAASRAFYEAVLPLLGYTVQAEFPNMCAFGPAGRPVFWVIEVAAAATRGGCAVPPLICVQVRVATLNVYVSAVIVPSETSPPNMTCTPCSGS